MVVVHCHCPLPLSQPHDHYLHSKLKIVVEFSINIFLSVAVISRSDDLEEGKICKKSQFSSLVVKWELIWEQKEKADAGSIIRSTLVNINGKEKSFFW